MDTLKTALYLFISLALSACGAKKSPETAGKTAQEIAETKHYQGEKICEALVRSAADKDLSGHSFAQIEGFVQEGPCVKISYYYSGCQKGKSQLFWPQQAEGAQGKRAIETKLILSVEGAGFCEMLIREERWFDLSSLNPQGQNFALRFAANDSLYYYQSQLLED